jgi:hypothetical protein
MSLRGRRSIPVALLLLFAGLAQAQQEKYSVYVNHNGDDAVGRSVVFALREAIRRSAAYEVADANGDADLHIEIVSIEDMEGHSAISAVGLVLVAPCADEYLFLHNVYSAGMKRADDLGKQILVDFDSMFVQGKRDLKNRTRPKSCPLK